MASIDEFAAAIGTAHGSVGDAGSSVVQSIDKAEELAGAFRTLSAEGKGTQVDEVTRELVEVQQQLASVGDELNALVARAAALRGSGGATGGKTSGSAGHSIPPNRGDGTTRPSLAPDSSRRPRGEPAIVEGTPDRKRAIGRENEAAVLLSQRGFDVEQNPPTLPNGKNPDYRMEGKSWDCYAPSKTRSIDKIRKSIKDKVGVGEDDRQASRILLNMDDNPGDPAELEALLRRRPIAGLEEIKIVRGGEVTDFYPFHSPSETRSSDVR